MSPPERLDCEAREHSFALSDAWGPMSLALADRNRDGAWDVLVSAPDAKVVEVVGNHMASAMGSVVDGGVIGNDPRSDIDNPGVLSIEKLGTSPFGSSSEVVRGAAVVGPLNRAGTLELVIADRNRKILLQRSIAGGRAFSPEGSTNLPVGATPTALAQAVGQGKAKSASGQPPPLLHACGCFLCPVFLSGADPEITGALRAVPCLKRHARLRSAVDQEGSGPHLRNLL